MTVMAILRSPTMDVDADATFVEASNPCMSRNAGTKPENTRLITQVRKSLRSLLVNEIKPSSTMMLLPENKY